MLSKTGLLAALVVAIALVIGLAAPRFLTSDADQPTTGGRAVSAAERASPGLTPVEVYEVVPQRFAETLVAPGTLVANERIDVVSEIAGTVLEILFAEGSRVAKDDVLVRIDGRELAAERDRIGARLELAERRTRRQAELHDQGLISDDELETAQTEADALRAELARTEVRLDKTEIRAPFAGVVGLRRISEGAYLSPQTLITTLIDSNPIKLQFAVPERYADRFAKGTEVRFEVEGAPGARRARVYAVEPTVDADTRTVPMRALASNDDGALLPGGFADVTLAVAEIEEALAVPSIAIIAELGGKKVFVAANGRVQPRQVESGIRTDQMVQITNGLAAGELVVTSGLQFLRPGLEVEITNRVSPLAPTSAAAASADGEVP